MIRRTTSAALALLAPLALAALASCGGGPQGRPTLPPPDYEAPGAGPDASATPPAGPAAPSAPSPAASGVAPSAAP